MNSSVCPKAGFRSNLAFDFGMCRPCKMKYGTQGPTNIIKMTPPALSVAAPSPSSPKIAIAAENTAMSTAPPTEDSEVQGGVFLRFPA
jgi:hypothetical protein